MPSFKPENVRAVCNMVQDVTRLIVYTIVILASLTRLFNYLEMRAGKCPKH